jgi:hypothetical protein
MGAEMTKREALHQWLLRQDDWVYLAEVPYYRLGMSQATCSSALIDMCEQGRVDFRVVGLKQYRGVDKPQIKPGPKPPKGKS